MTSLLLIQGTLPSCATASGAIVNFGYTKYQGAVVQDQISNATYTQFLEICFAASPTGTYVYFEPTY